MASERPARRVVVHNPPDLGGSVLTCPYQNAFLQGEMITIIKRSVTNRPFARQNQGRAVSGWLKKGDSCAESIQ